MSDPTADAPRDAAASDEERLAKLVAVAENKITWAEALGISRSEAYGMAEQAQRFLDIGQVDRARGIIEGLVALNPKDAYFHAFLGALRGQKGDDDGALESYSNAIRLDGKNLAARVNRAELYLKRGELEQAIDDLVAATKIDPQGSTPLGKRALSLARATAAALHQHFDGPKPAAKPAPAPEKKGFFKGLFGK